VSEVPGGEGGNGSGLLSDKMGSMRYQVFKGCETSEGRSFFRRKRKEGGKLPSGKWEERAAEIERKNRKSKIWTRLFPTEEVRAGDDKK